MLTKLLAVTGRKCGLCGSTKDVLHFRAQRGMIGSSTMELCASCVRTMVGAWAVRDRVNRGTGPLRLLLAWARPPLKLDLDEPWFRK